MPERQFVEMPWDTPGLPPRTLRERCAHHLNHCAYRDDDPARCPWCHCTWEHLKRAGHSTCLAFQTHHVRQSISDSKRKRHEA